MVTSGTSGQHWSPRGVSTLITRWLAIRAAVGTVNVTGTFIRFVLLIMLLIRPLMPLAILTLLPLAIRYMCTFDQALSHLPKGCTTAGTEALASKWSKQVDHIEAVVIDCEQFWWHR